MAKVVAKKSKSPRDTKVKGLREEKQLDLLANIELDEDQKKVLQSIDFAKDEDSEEEFTFFEVIEEGTDSIYASIDLKDKILSLYREAKQYPRSEYRRIRFLVPTCDPIAALKKHEGFMTRVQETNDKRELVGPRSVQAMDSLVWNPGTVVELPPNVAEFYVNQRYFLGYEGLGDPGKFVSAATKNIPPKYQHIAEYVD